MKVIFSLFTQFLRLTELFCCNSNYGITRGTRGKKQRKRWKGGDSYCSVVEGESWWWRGRVNSRRGLISYSRINEKILSSIFDSDTFTQDTILWTKDIRHEELASKTRLIQPPLCLFSKSSFCGSPFPPFFLHYSYLFIKSFNRSQEIFSSCHITK